MRNIWSKASSATSLVKSILFLVLAAASFASADPNDRVLNVCHSKLQTVRAQDFYQNCVDSNFHRLKTYYPAVTSWECREAFRHVGASTFEICVQRNFRNLQRTEGLRDLNDCLVVSPAWNADFKSCVDTNFNILNQHLRGQPKPQQVPVQTAPPAETAAQRQQRLWNSGVFGTR